MVSVSKSRVGVTSIPGLSQEKKKEREVKYPFLYSEWFLRNDSKTRGPLTSKMFMDLLGWEDEDQWLERKRKENPGKEDLELEPFPKEFFAIDQRGKKFLLHNNTHNRPWGLDHTLTLAQDILNRFWADTGNRKWLEDNTLTCNGEAMIIGRTGLCLSIQHRGLAVIFAEQIRQGFGIGQGQEQHWNDIWGDEEIAIEGVINYGVSESNKTLRTLDNNKPRTFSDVLFSDPTLTSHMSKEDVLIYTKMVDHGIRLLWDRTRENENGYAPRRTQSEAMNFLLNHPSIKACAVGVLQANGKRDKTGNKIANHMSLGDACGVCYLMACSEMDNPEDYWKAEIRREGLGEDHCKATRIKDAVEFWKRFSTHIDFRYVRDAFGMLSSADKGQTPGGHRAEKLAILCHTWEAYLAGEEITEELCTPKRERDKTTGKWKMQEWPDFGGIDKGPHKPSSPKRFKAFSDTDIDAVLGGEVLTEEQVDSLLDGEPSIDDIPEIDMDEEDSVDDMLMNGDEEDISSVEEAKADKAKEIVSENEEILKKIYEKENPTPPPMTPTNAFDGWNKDIEKSKKVIKRKT